MTRRSVFGIAASLAATLSLAGFASGQIGGGGVFGPGTADYALVDKIEDSWVNRNPIPYRPMVAMGENTFWVVNPYLSEVVKLLFDPGTFEVEVAAVGGRFRTLPGPVSIARYQPSAPEAHEQLLVVCQHANAVAVHDAVTLDLIETISVPAGPADMLVQIVDASTHLLWVSCTPADVVVEINLMTRVQRLYRLTTLNANREFVSGSRFPGFLSMSNGQVFVAPRVSGNGSLVDRKNFELAESPAPINPPTKVQDFNEHAGGRGILEPTQMASGLPDHDLFWLDRTAVVARPVAKSTGTLLFAHAVRPTTSEIWQLNLEANNDDPVRQSESAIRGDIVRNRLTMIPIPTTLDENVVPVPETQLTILQLDDIIPTTQDTDIDFADPPVAIGTPYSLAFNSSGTTCAVTGLMSDNVIVLDEDGDRILGGGHILSEDDPSTTGVDENENTMPRQVLFAGTSIVGVWGANLTVHFVDLSNPSQHAFVRFGFDPTPEPIRKGRSTFFDASHSMHANASCASCHDEGKTDMLAWNLSDIDAGTNDGVDNKGPMVTQTLTGISTAMPFHWRGEQLRGMGDFNAAFDKLLGGDPLSGITEVDGEFEVEEGGEFDGFEKFILSLTEDANQFQHRNRVLKKAIQIPEDPVSIGGTEAANPSNSSAIAGQQLFVEICARCHALPKGTTNEIVDNAFGGEVKVDRLWLKVAPYQGLQFKAKQNHVRVQFNGTGFPDEQVYPVLGTGLSHAGVVRDAIPFMQILLSNGDNRTALDRRDLANFLYQFDTGTAPATHVSQFINSANAASVIDTATSTVNWLIGQASTTTRNCDIAVVGRLSSNSATSPFFGWVYDRKTGMFFGPDQAGLGDAPHDLGFFKARALAGGWFAFIGMPVGTAWRFAADFDGDQLANQLEVSGFNMLDPDSDDDGVLDGAAATGGGEPAINADLVDDTPDSIPATPDFQWVTQRTARMTFETDELTTAKLTLTPHTTPNDPTIVVEETIPKLQHNLVVSELIHTLTYDVELRITDMGKLPLPNQTNTVIITPPDLVVADRLENEPFGLIQPAFVVRNLASTTRVQDPGNPNRWTFTYTGNVTRRLSSLGGANQLVAARAFIKGVPATGSQFVSNGQPTTFDVNGKHYHPTELTFPDGLDLDTNPDPIPGAIPGPFVFAVANAGGGAFTIAVTLDLTGIAFDPTNRADSITFAIEALGLNLTPGASGRPNMAGNAGEGRFNDIDTVVGDNILGDDDNTAGTSVPSFFNMSDTTAANRSITLWRTATGWTTTPP